MVAQSWSEVVSGERTARMAYVVMRRLDAGDKDLWLPAAACMTEEDAEMLVDSFGGIVKAVPVVEVRQ